MSVKNNYGGFEDPEKIDLIKKIKELEKNMIDNKKLEKAEFKRKDSLTKEELEKKMKEQEEENKKFKEYREKQMKENEEIEAKLKRLQEQKEKEEELLKNDVNKLQEKIKQLNSEIEDLKNENSKDRTDYLEDVKEISKENDLYKKIINILFNDNQYKKICEMSRYIEEDDLWKIKPFTIKEKKLNFPNVLPSQIDTFIEGNIAKRELVINGINDSSKKIIFQNYEDEESTSPKKKESFGKLKLNLNTSKSNLRNTEDDSFTFSGSKCFVHFDSKIHFFL